MKIQPEIYISSYFNFQSNYYRNNILPVLAIIIIFILRYYDLIFQYNTLSPFRDNTHFFGPEFSYISNVFKNGDYPYWIQSMLGGVQFYDNAQFSIDYPFYFLDHLDYQKGAETLRLISLISIFHILILSLNTYILLRVLNISYVGSFIGSIIHMISINTSIYAKWIVIISAYSWFPLYIAGIFILFKRTNSLSNLIIIPLSILGFTANPAQPLIHAFFFGAIIYIVLFISAKNKFQILKSTFNIVIISFSLIAVVIIPILLNMPDMIRWVGKGKSVIGNEQLPREVFTSPFSLESITSIIFDSASKIEHVGSLYIGPICFCLIGIGIYYLLKREKDPLIKSFLIVTGCLSLYAFLSGFGDYTGFSSINYNIPLINKIREPERHLFFYVLISSIFAGYGFDKVLTNYTDKKKYILLIILTFISSILLLDYKIGFLFFTFSLILLQILYFIIAKIKSPKYSFTCILLILLLSNSFLTKKGIILSTEKWDYFKDYNIASMDILDYINNNCDPNYRVVYHDKNLSGGIWSMNSLYYGIRSLQSQHVPIPYNQFKELYNHDDKYLYRVLQGCRYHIFKANSHSNIQSHFKFIYKNNHYSIYEDEMANERVFAVQNVEQHFEELTGLLKRLNEGIDLKKTALVLPNDYNKILAFLNISHSDTVTINENKISHNSFSYFTASESNFLLILNEYFHQNWKVKINKINTPPLKVNQNQIGVLVPKGNNTIEFLYHPNYINFLWLLRYLGYTFIIFTFLLKLISWLKGRMSTQEYEQY